MPTLMQRNRMFLPPDTFLISFEDRENGENRKRVEKETNDR